MLVALAAAVRLWGLDFGLPNTQCRPDENLPALLALGFLRGDPNPHFFNWPSLYMYALAVLYLGYYLMGRAAGAFPALRQFASVTQLDWTPFHLIGRGLSALLGTATVVVVYRLASCLFSRATGLVAAFFLSLCFLHVRHSHFGVMDVPVTLFAMWSMLFLVRGHFDRRGRDFVFAGVLGGLATATKYNAVALLVPALASAGIHLVDARAQGARGLDCRLVLFAAAFAAAFVAGTPFAVLDPRHFLTGLVAEARNVRVGPGIDLGPGWIHHLRVSLRYGLGWPLLLAGGLGFVVLWVQDWRRAALVSAFPVTYYAVAGGSHTVFARYAVPLAPFLCVSAAALVVTLAGALPGRGPLRAAATVTLALAVVLPSAWSVVRFDRLLARTDSRLLAARWMEEHVPGGSSILQTGSPYGQVQLGWRRRAQPGYARWSYDPGRRVFLSRGRVVDGLPEWIIVQESPLVLYSETPAFVSGLVGGGSYTLVQAFRALDMDAPGNVFDQQDAFFLPLAGFHRIHRPGPNLYIYRRSDVVVR